MALSITFADAVKLGLKKYKTIKGVSSRTEYWYFQLFRILVLLVASVIDSVIGKSADTMFGSGGFLTNVLTAALFIPDISVTVRRFKDAGFSGHWLWGQLVLSAAVIFFFVEMMLSPGVLTLIQQGSAANQAEAESVVMAIPGWIMGGASVFRYLPQLAMAFSTSSLRCEQLRPQLRATNMLRLSNSPRELPRKKHFGYA